MPPDAASVTLDLQALDVRIPLRLTGRPAQELLGPALRALVAPTAGSGGQEPWVVEPDGRTWWLRQGRSTPKHAEQPGGLLGEILHRLNWAVAGSSPTVALHAGGVRRDHVGILLPGASEAGKSTLTAGLVRAGCDYLSDEAVGITDDTGEAIPYPKPLTLDPGSHRFFPELAAVAARYGPDPEGAWHVPIDDLRRGAAAALCPVRLVVFCQYRAGAGTELTRMSRARAAFELASCTFRFRERPRRSLDALAALVRGATCYRLTNGDLRPAVDTVLELSEECAVGEPCPEGAG